MGQDSRTVRLPIFPLTGALLFPGLQLPLHIFEPRYRAMISNSLVRDRRIAMIQPQVSTMARRCSRSVASARSVKSRRWRTGATTSSSKAFRASACCANSM
jgi:Lon protease-like protein